ncbi:MAG: pantetheine-phosphate adenylyltransferase [Bacteroidetes bacterium CG2_30_33_31]|nr:MAG: pantetheine-phosphate adenylyltransferase [Bacteroidetes bacterium CG2_30_33_31]
MKIAVFPGSFDPITVGHESVINRALALFDKIIIAVGVNSSKNNMFTIEERIEFIEDTFSTENKIQVVNYEGLTVDFCKKNNAKFILRGLRTAADFEFERSIGQVNTIMDSSIETIFLLTSAAHAPIASSVVRDIIKNRGDITDLVPKAIEKYFKKLK